MLLSGKHQASVTRLKNLGYDGVTAGPLMGVITDIVSSL